MGEVNCAIGMKERVGRDMEAFLSLFYNSATIIEPWHDSTRVLRTDHGSDVVSRADIAGLSSGDAD